VIDANHEWPIGTELWPTQDNEYNWLRGLRGPFLVTHSGAGYVCFGELSKKTPAMAPQLFTEENPMQKVFRRGSVFDKVMDAKLELTKVDGVEVIVRPEHYTRFKVEPITFIMGNNLGFAVGNIVKYAVRAGSKLYSGKTAVESEILDLEKVRRYAEMRINQLQGKETL
jgi:hypothetical protein